MFHVLYYDYRTAADAFIRSIDVFNVVDALSILWTPFFVIITVYGYFIGFLCGRCAALKRAIVLDSLPYFLDFLFLWASSPCMAASLVSSWQEL